MRENLLAVAPHHTPVYTESVHWKGSLIYQVLLGDKRLKCRILHWKQC